MWLCFYVLGKPPAMKKSRPITMIRYFTLFLLGALFCTGFVFGQNGTTSPAKIDTPALGAFTYVATEAEPLNLDSVRTLIGYPYSARSQDIMGKIVVRVLVNKKGQCADYVIIKKAHPLLTKAVEAEVEKIRFTPALKYIPGSEDKTPIMMWVNIPFQFCLLK